MSCGLEIANHDLSVYLYIYCIPTYNLLMTAHLGYRRGVFGVCEIPWIYIFCYLFLKTGSCVLSVFSDRVAVITVSNSTISFSSQARQCHDGQLCDKRKMILHTINSHWGKKAHNMIIFHQPSQSSHGIYYTPCLKFSRTQTTLPTPSPHDRDFDQGVPVSCSVDVCSGITLFYPLWIAPAFLLRGAMLKQGVIQRDKAI